MKQDLLNILKHREHPISNEQLIAYLTGKLSAAEQHELEEQLATNQMDNDMLEGLQYVKDASKIPGYTFELEQALRNKLGSGRAKRTGIVQANLWWWIGGVVLLLALAIIAWYLVSYTAA